MKSDPEIELQKLKDDFAAWRSSRIRGARIPDEFWRRTLDLCGPIKQSRVIRVLNLDGTSLKRRLNQLGDSQSDVQLVELPMPKLGGRAASKAKLIAEITTASGSYGRLYSGASSEDIENLRNLLKGPL